MKDFIRCKFCGETLIERLGDGTLRFVFGRKSNDDGSLSDFVPVDIVVAGAMKIKCFRRKCGKYNYIRHSFPEIKKGQSVVAETLEDKNSK